MLAVVLNKPQVLHTFASFALIMMCVSARAKDRRLGVTSGSNGRSVSKGRRGAKLFAALATKSWELVRKIVAYLWAKVILLPCTGSCLDDDDDDDVGPGRKRRVPKENEAMLESKGESRRAPGTSCDP